MLLCGGCVCYCMGCVCNCVGVVFVIVWGCICYFEGCVCYCVVAVFVIVIFVWLFKFNDVVWDNVGEVRGWRLIMCYLCQFEIGALDKGLLDLSV